MLLLEIQDHVFMLCHPRKFFKESETFVLFCNRTFDLLFHFETLTMTLDRNSQFLYLSPQRGAANAQGLGSFRQVAVRRLRGD